MTPEAQIHAFCRLARARSDEHRAALSLLGPANLVGPMMAILRQELDSMVRAIYLLQQSADRRNDLVATTLRGQRWKQDGRNAPVRDHDMIELAQTLQGWTRSVYKFGCAFIHLSTMHDYLANDPLGGLSADERSSITQHIQSYHNCTLQADFGLDDLRPLIPNVFEKIAGNLACYLRDLEGGVTASHSEAG